MKLFTDLTTGTFLKRPHRFCLTCMVDGIETDCYLPNPGRLSELLFTGALVYLKKSKKADAKQKYVAVAIESTIDGTKTPVMLHTHKTNDVAEYLLRNKLIPSFKDATVTAREVKHKNSRFDILLKENGKDIMTEVKSCTLFHKDTAMFPDAVTSRGKRHVEELAELSKSGVTTAVIFIVHSPNVKRFLPEYHTDPEFADTLYKFRKDIRIIPVSIGYKKDLSLDTSQVKEIPIDWKVYQKERSDKGVMILVAQLEKETTIEGKMYKKGFYLSVIKSDGKIHKEIERYKRKRKTSTELISLIRNESKSFKALAIESPTDKSSEIQNKVENISDNILDKKNNIYYFKENPIGLEQFQEILLYYRMDLPFKKS